MDFPWGYWGARVHQQVRSNKYQLFQEWCLGIWDPHVWNPDSWWESLFPNEVNKHGVQGKDESRIWVSYIFAPLYDTFWSGLTRAPGESQRVIGKSWGAMIQRTKLCSRQIVMILMLLLRLVNATCLSSFSYRWWTHAGTLNLETDHLSTSLYQSLMV